MYMKADKNSALTLQEHKWVHTNEIILARGTKNYDVRLVDIP